MGAAAAAVLRQRAQISRVARHSLSLQGRAKADIEKNIEVYSSVFGDETLGEFDVLFAGIILGFAFTINCLTEKI